MLLFKRLKIIDVVRLVLLRLLWLGFINAKKDNPDISSHQFDSAPTNFFYFDDSNTVLLDSRDTGRVYRSEDAGKTWDKVDIEDGKAMDLWAHPYDKNQAFILGREGTHWHTKNQGKTWKDFEIPNARPLLFRNPLAFHAKDTDKVMIHGETCKLGGLLDCQESIFITRDGFETVEKMRENTRGCIFAHGTPEFQTSKDDKNDNRIICVSQGRVSFDRSKHRLVVSDDFFKNEKEPYLEAGRTVQGIINIAGVKSYVVAAARALNTDELALYVTGDADTWHRAVFPHDSRLKEDAYTILESTKYSIQVDVMNVEPPNPMGILFTSNSNGTYFTKNIPHTNRNRAGNVDFEKVQNIQGIVIVNVVDNWKEVESSFGTRKKDIKSQITFDEGRSFQDLTVGKKPLHLHSVTDISNVGRVFSSPAPGLVMGVGNTGKYLKNYDEGDLYVSDDAGLTWTLAIEEAHKYEFGDQGSILVAVYDEGPTDKIEYSLNHGKEWHKVDLPEKGVNAKALITTPDSTAMKFLLLATTGGGSKMKHWAFSIDFEDMHERKCKDSDFENWYALSEEDSEPGCIMGHQQLFRRRKADADCFIRERFKDPEPEFKKCKCTEKDFECDYDYKKSEDGKECIWDTKAGPLPDPKGKCKGQEGPYLAPSGFRLIPGNECEGGIDLEKEVERPCKDTVKTPVSGEVNVEKTAFRAKGFKEYYYLETTESSDGDDETIVMRTDKSEIYITKDHGKTWKHILEDKKITRIYPHAHFNDVVYFLTAGKTVHLSINRGDTFSSFEAKAEPTRDRSLAPLSFHPDYKDWLIWTGAQDCENGEKGTCHNRAYYSTDRGGEWKNLLFWVRKCEFIKEEGRGKDENSDHLVYCEQYEHEKPGGRLQLWRSDNWFANKKQEFQDIVSFATMSEFIIVASYDQENKNTLKVGASVDGKNFADALFPSNFHVQVQTAYTVLDSHTHAVFLHVTVGSSKGAEYGSIIKSNSNGTSYVLSLNGVNRNTPGYVDFEKMLGLEGVALVNIVANIEDAERGLGKKLRTMITHNDCAEWAPLKAPQKDSEGHKYPCDVGDLEKCSLHLHAYTERRDTRTVFSSPSAVGLMMGVGNVGDSLTDKSSDTSDTFITRDGGVSWHAVQKGNYMWEYGDQGSIIVIVRDTVATDEILYSLDEGSTWTPFKFSKKKVHVAILSTVPSDTSRNFLLWGQEDDSDSEVVTFNLDFTQLKERQRQCKLDIENPEAEDSDYYLWEPKHPLQKNNCLFGHIAQYIRKNLDADCFNGGSTSIQKKYNIKQNCSCTRQDFECDYNYESGNDRNCQLVPGLPQPDHSQVCNDDPSRETYYLPTGYRRIPLDTCQGGRELEKWESKEKPCPGKEPEYARAHRGLSGFWIFVLAVLLPAGAAGGIGYWVWQHWDGKFGRIQLNDGGRSFDTDGAWVRWPVAVVSAVVAVVAAVPLLAGSLWRWAGGLFGGRSRRYTTRSSFARGRGDYAVVDEDELLGEDEDEEA